MRVVTKILTLAVITGASVLASNSASAWWNSDNDYWDRGPWYGGYGGYPGYGGWGQHTPRVEIYTQPQGSGSSQGYRIE